MIITEWQGLVRRQVVSGVAPNLDAHYEIGHSLFGLTKT